MWCCRRSRPLPHAASPGDVFAVAKHPWDGAGSNSFVALKTPDAKKILRSLWQTIVQRFLDLPESCGDVQVGRCVSRLVAEDWGHCVVAGVSGRDATRAAHVLYLQIRQDSSDTLELLTASEHKPEKWPCATEDFVVNQSPI